MNLNISLVTLEARTAGAGTAPIGHSYAFDAFSGNLRCLPSAKLQLCLEIDVTLLLLWNTKLYCNIYYTAALQYTTTLQCTASL